MTETTRPRSPAAPGPALLLPGGLALGLLAFLLFPQVGADAELTRTFVGAAVVVGAWATVLNLRARAAGVPLTLEIVLRKPHYVQMCAQGAVLLYWGWWVRSVYAFAPYIVAQLLFAYAVESLLSWTRHRSYRMGVGPFPVVFSINLFLWFKLEWFHWQFAMVALVYLGKEFLRWNRDGRSTHVFNPSAFALGVTSLLLIVTGSTDRTLGLEIAATQNIPPGIFTAIFVASLPGQLLFGVTTMTMAAVVSAYGFGLAYFWLTGTYFFYDAYIPIAVFLGMHLLFTDPATAPRSERGRVLFGVLYGLGTIAFAGLLDTVGAPTFYDKLLPVPILNLMARRLDRIADSGLLKLPEWRGWNEMGPARRRVAVVGAWVVTFLSIRALGGVGDDHPGQYLPFWEGACTAGSERACGYLAVMQQSYCDRGSGWACNELGIHRAERERDARAAEQEFVRACRLEYAAGCENARFVAGGRARWARGDPPLRELPIVLRGSKGPVIERSPAALYALACERGWSGTCARAGPAP